MADDLYGSGYVYLIERDDGWYRIGRTANLEQRFRQIRWEHGRYKDLTLLCLVSVLNQHRAEKLFHRIFRDKRTDERNRGMGPCKEWFRLSRADIVRFSTWAEIIGTDVLYLALDLTDDDWLQQVREIADG